MANRARIAVAYDCLFPYSTGGGERQYRAFAEELASRGHDVDYLTSTQWPGATPDEGSFTIVPVSGAISLYSPDGVRRIPAALRYAAGLFLGLARRRRRYEAVIVSGLPVFNVFATRLALLGSGTKVVVDYLEVWHRPQWVKYSGRLTGTIAWMLQRAAILLTPIATCHSQLSATRLVREGLRSDPVVSPGLIDSAVEAAPVSPASDPPYVLYAGRHIPDKRVETLPAAVAVARRSVPDLRLVILGTGPSSPAIRSAVDRVNGAEWTEFPGFVDDAELEARMHGALCLVNPSRREGYGLVVVEANAHGTPVVLVADEGNASTELVEANVNGFVSPSADAHELADAIVRTARAGRRLRDSARGWYDDALRTRTISRTVEGILAALHRAPHRAATQKEDTP
jgi:glycosyltransferase involved in cell wall biosynthesis